MFTKRLRDFYTNSPTELKSFEKNNQICDETCQWLTSMQKITVERRKQIRYAIEAPRFTD